MTQPHNRIYQPVVLHRCTSPDTYADCPACQVGAARKQARREEIAKLRCRWWVDGCTETFKDELERSMHHMYGHVANSDWTKPLFDDEYYQTIDIATCPGCGAYGKFGRTHVRNNEECGVFG